MYSSRITRANPTAFIFLIDHSGSMEEKMMFGHMPATKAEVVAIVTNMLIAELINRCRRDEDIADYFDIAAVGYSGERARMLLPSGDGFLKPSVLERMDCRTGVVTQERVFPDGHVRPSFIDVKYRVEPKSEGSTPMRSALEMALDLLTRWCRRPGNEFSYPPTVFNITDGEATDGDNEILCELASQIKSLGTKDGNALLININISSKSSETTLLFPSGKERLPDCRYTQMLYEMSSEMPPQYNESIMELKGQSAGPFRGMSLNTSAASLISMMDIGSRSINKIG